MDRGNLDAFELQGPQSFALWQEAPSEGAAPANAFSLDAVKSSFTETKERVKETLGVFKERGVLRRREYAGVAPQVHGAPRNAEVGHSCSTYW